MTQKPYHLVINSNRFFSAVSDYSFQLAYYLKKKGYDINLFSSENNILPLKCEESSISFQRFNLYPRKFLSFMPSLITLFLCLFRYSRKRKLYIWCFEGREQFWLLIFKLILFFKRQSIVLIRVRGQAQKQKKSIFSYLVYFLTDKIILTSNTMKASFPFSFSSAKLRVHYYMKEIMKPKSFKNNLSHEQNFFFPFNSPFPVFASVGRFDPVKGQKHLIEGFCKTPFQGKVSLVIIGCSKNIQASELLSLAKRYLFEIEGSLPYVKLKKDNLSIYLVDAEIKNLSYLMQRAHYGVISSLGSEMICRVGVEFLQLGTPLISSKVGALEEVLKTSSTIFYDHLNEESLISAFLKAESIINDSESYKKTSRLTEEFGRDRYALDGFQKLLAFVSR